MSQDFGTSILKFCLNNLVSEQSDFKGNAQFIFLCNLQKPSIVCLIKLLKNHCHKKVTVCFYNLGEQNF